MKKSFKKALAAFLAALMVIFSVPFTALAAYGEYNPDVQLQFGTFHAGDATDWRDYNVTSSGKDFSLCGLFDVPLEYNAKTGTITMSAAKAAKAAEVVGYTAPAEDVQYGVGDYFTVTVTIDNIAKLFASQEFIQYSDNIEPAGYYSYKSGRNTYWRLGTASEATAKGGAFTVGGTAPYSVMSASDLYPTEGGLQCLAEDDDKTKIIDPELRIMKVALAAQNGYFCDVSSTHNDIFANPETGELAETGYTYTNKCIAETFVFKITGEGPITFDLYDKDNTKVAAYGGCYYIADSDEGISTSQYVTYAPSYGAPNGSTDPNAGAENVGSRKMTFMGTNIHNGSTEPEVHTHTYDSVTTPADCTHDGYITYTCNNSDGLGTAGDDTYVEGVDLHPELAKLGHDYQITSETDSTCKIPGEIVYECTRCHDTYTDYKELAKDHTPVLDDSTAVAATCKTDGKEADTVCSVCGKLISEGAVISKDTVPHTPVSADNAVPATCAKDGKEADTVCSVCGKLISEGAVISKDTVAHTFTNYAYNNDATCGVDGTETATCDVCGNATDTRTKAGSALTHDYQEVPGSAIEATYDNPGKEADKKCTHCGDVIVGATIPALSGIKVTVLASALGTATVNGTDVTTDDVTINVAEKSDVVLTATATSGAKFIGWNVDGKLVSTEANITVKALANVTYKPVFQAAAETFTVVFTDKFGNIYDTQTVANGADIDIPEAPVIAGYNFVGWSMTDVEIAALDAAATINAKYERIAEATYTVRADGCTISTPYATTQDVNAGIGYDTLVTVTAPGATAWKINGATVAYGESYSFYVGADVTIEVVKDSVTATPTVAAVSVSEIGTTGKLKASFLATRSMTADTTFVNAGFVYAINPAADTITLADVNGSTVLAGYCATDSEQFCLNVGRISQTGRIVARAFLAYVDGEGVTQVVYAEPQAYTYA